jgi:hypothetical protein
MNKVRLWARIYRRKIMAFYAIGLTILMVFSSSSIAQPSERDLETRVFNKSLTHGQVLIKQEAKTIVVQARGCSRFFFAEQSNDSIREEEKDTIHTKRSRIIKLKDPNKALLYAIVPGCIVHGTGHFYAGEKTTGWILVAGEALSLSLFTYSVGVGIGESTNGSTSNGEAEIIGIFAGTLFLGSWIYDLIGAPKAVQRNKKQLNQKSTGLEFRMKDAGPKLAVVWRF